MSTTESHPNPSTSGPIGSVGAVETGSKLLPWLWIPTLYFAESIPNAVVSDTSNFFYTDFGLTPEKLGLITGSMYLPWVFKPLWSPLVDSVKTKRWWIVFTQILLGLTFGCLAFSVQSENWLNLTAACFWALAFISATHDIAADGFYLLGLSELAQAGFTGIRSTAYRLAMIFAKGLLVYFAGHFTVTLGSKVSGWSAVMAIPALFYALSALYHGIILPRPQADRPVESEFGVLGGFKESFSTFFQKPNILSAIPIMLLFRFAEAQLLTMAPLFLKGPLDQGGLALTNEQVGFAYGVIGVGGLMLGGISAGALVAKFGLRKLFWILIVIMHLPNVAFLGLALTQNTNIQVVSATLFLEQFGYGFGFTAYMLYLMYFARGQHKTSHYAICTGFMALSMMIPKMISGYIKAKLSFAGFFIYIMLATIPSFIVSIMAYRDKEFIDFFQPKDQS